MTQRRFLFLPLTATLLLTAAFSPASTHHATDDPDLIYDAATGDIAAAREILKDDQKPDVTDDDGHTALMRAAEHGHTDIIKLLLENGAVINRADSLGKTALIWAAEGGDGDAIDTLVQAGARIEQATKEGITPLMAAARSGQVDAVVHLLAAGAQADRSDYSGRDPLGWAQESHNSRVIELIRKAQKH
jgi:uncharacterized protein